MEKLFDVPLKLNQMYLRGKLEKSNEGFKGSLLSTDTYFGCFPCEAYAENTTVEQVTACVRIKGTGTAEMRLLDDAVKQETFDTGEFIILHLSTLLPSSSVLYLKLSGNFEVSNIWYEGDGKVRNTKISIIICTYKREEYVKRNLEILSAYIDRKLEVICVDNGGTLTNVPAGVKLIKNRNYGGSGGYARGMMEAADSTHFWLMDDDIEFEPEIVQRAVTFFQHRNREDLSLAAGMFSFEEPTVQKEATAVFDGYTFHSNASGLDFCEPISLLQNRIEQKKNTYGGWWSLVMPASEQLPLPFFIKLDDVEYGIRNCGKYVVMNGFGVWHEAFGKKGNAWSEYYTTRNTLITQAVHPDIPRSSVKMMGVRLLKALAYDEPKCMEAAVKGVEDYAAGSNHFRCIDPEKNHKEIMEQYRAPLAQDMSRKKMIRSAVKNVLKPKNWNSVSLFFKSVRTLGKHKQDEGWKDMATESFWRDYLGV